MPSTTTIFFSGVGTLVFIAATAGRGQRLGLPSYTGSSFAFISPVIAAESHGTAAALGGIFAAGALLFICGFLVDRFGARPVNALMPPVVTGAVVALIGLNLAPVATGDMEKEGYTAFITLAAILGTTVLLRGFLGRISILIGVAVGYLVSWPFHQLDLHHNWSSAKWVGLPPFHAPSFTLYGITLVLPVVLVLLAENTGHVKAVASMTGRNYDASLGRAYMGDGLDDDLRRRRRRRHDDLRREHRRDGGDTRISTAAYVVAGLTAIGLGCIPKFGAIVESVPTGVLGGATILLYGLIAVLGGRIWVEHHVDSEARSTSSRRQSGSRSAPATTPGRTGTCRSTGSRSAPSRRSSCTTR